MKKTRLWALGLVVGLGAQAGWANASQQMCVFDIVGRNGPAFGFAKDYALQASQWGANIELEAYTDERLAAEDFKT
ncbi:MAG: hypothetical protein R3194_09015, partial [Limnobacter sp.]|nr:hypothetical protein [Limnobacter sp.]